MVLSKNRITLLALFRSFNALFALFLIYPEVFFYYISRQISTPFFITDSNILAARYFSGVLFFLYVYFLPFFFVFSIFWVIPSCSQFTHDLRLRLSILAVYFHLITVFFNHFDLSDFDYNPIISVFSNSRGMDFSSFTSQYRGTYWDIFGVVFIYFVGSSAVFENLAVLEQIRYSINHNSFFIRKGKRTRFWSVFRITWLVRLILSVMVFYFFCGESLFSDCLVRLSATCILEIFFVFVRWVYFLRSVAVLLKG